MKRRLILGLLLSTLSRPGYAKHLALKVAPGEPSPLQSQILDAVRRRFPSSSLLQGNARGQGDGLILAIGPAGLRQALQADLEDRILTLFVSGPTFQDLTGSLGPSAKRRTTAIFAEPSIPQQMALIEKLFGRQVVVGVLLGMTTGYLEPQLKQAARAAGMELVVEHLGDESANRALLRLTSANVLLALPDKDIYNPMALREVLETTYRRSLPIVGYSAGMVTAGCLAATYAALDDILAHATELVESLSSGATWPEPQFPRYWRTAINEHVARSMNIVIDKAVQFLSNPPPKDMG